jgi:DNA polymerase
MVLSDYPDDEDYNSQKILSGNKGRLLSKMLSSISLDEEKYYLSNIFFEKMNKTLIEYNFYENILFKHIKIIKPKYILLLGESVLNFINNLNQKILDLHGKWGYKTIEKNKFLIFFTFSPEELIKDEGNKKLAWEDLKIFRNEIHKIK